MKLSLRITDEIDLCFTTYPKSLELGRLEKIPLRDVWEREDTHFTPWLEQHLPELQRAIHALAPITITDTQTEITTGDVRCDILGSIGQEKIIIENMLTKTDFEHLGKCITYASIHKAKHIVWIAEKFKEEHLSAIDWLNENFNLDSEINFYAVEVSVKVIKKDGIITGPPAPDFIAVRQPDFDIKNQRREVEHKEYSERKINRKKFWDELIDANGKINPKWKDRKSHYGTWLNSYNSKVGNTTFIFRGPARRSIPSIQLWIGNARDRAIEKIWKQLTDQKSSIEQKWNSLSDLKLLWESPENRASKTIVLESDLKIDFKNSSEEDNRKCKEWFMENMKKFEELFIPIIKELKV